GARQRFVSNDEGRLRGQRASDGQALSLSAGELVRQTVQILMTWSQAYAFEQGDRLRLTGNSTHGQGLQQMSPSGSDRIEGCGRILRDRLQLGPHLSKLSRGKLMQRASGNENRTAVGCEQAERDPAKCRLSGTALADQGDRFPGSDVQIDRAN